MIPRDLLSRWFKRPAANSRARDKYLAVIFFDGPLTKWVRSGSTPSTEPSGLRVPHDRPPNAQEIIQQRVFRTRWLATIWAVARIKGFDPSKVAAEVRSL